jgi:hypothetical protein
MLKRTAASRYLVLPGLLLFAVLVYWPGLHGNFLFDDFSNLPSLGAQGPVDNWASFWRYLTSGAADPTGRPLTLLTFLLDANNWPADPYPFKRTNLILHLCNGALLYSLLAELGQQLNYEVRRAKFAALLGTALWLLHPLLVSTTLYIVQREAMLPATCIMVGLRLWLHGHSKLRVGKFKTGLSWSALGLAGFTLLGTLTKANGALLPVCALLIDIIVLARCAPLPARAQHAHRVVIWLLATLPTTAIIVYLVWIGAHGMSLGGLAAGRSWTYAQRLLTEPRVLIDYLQLLWMPRPLSSGLFNDQYVASTSWMHPLSTVPAALGVCTLIGGAWWQRARHPALALAILFYFAGHLLESTTVPLELYFEHRNYLPALLMFWPLGLWVADWRSMRTLKYVLMATLPLMLGWMTHARAEVWGDQRTQALVWAWINPDSPRAQINAAQIEMQAGRPQDAMQRLESLLVRQPGQAQLAFNLIGASCLIDRAPPAYVGMAIQAMGTTANVGALFTQWFERITPMVVAGRCPGLTPRSLLDMINVGLNNPNLSAAGPQQDLTYLRGKLALAECRPDAALAEFMHALDLQVRPGMALEAAATLGMAGYPMQGLHLLDHYQSVQQKVAPPSTGMPMLHAWVLARQNYWPQELVHLRHQLNLDASGNNGHTSLIGSCHGLPPGAVVGQN